MNDNISLNICSNKPEGRKTSLAGVSIFTSQLLEALAYSVSFPCIIRLYAFTYL